MAPNRLRAVAPAILLTSVAAGLAWFLAHDVLGHPQPFFAPIAAAVCLSASNVLRAQRAIQMIIGVALGIGVGVGARDLLGGGPVAIGLAALVSLGVAVLLGRGFIAQGLMFYNQTAASAILILTTQETATGTERLIDALIGGGLARCPRPAATASTSPRWRMRRSSTSARRWPASRRRAHRRYSHRGRHPRPFLAARQPRAPRHCGRPRMRP